MLSLLKICCCFEIGLEWSSLEVLWGKELRKRVLLVLILLLGLIRDVKCVDKVKALVACLLWQVSKARCAYTFENKAYDPMSITVQIATDLPESYWQANGWNPIEGKDFAETSIAGAGLASTDAEWIGMKLNCDGAFIKNDKAAAIGFVHRDGSGSCLCLRGEIVESISPFMTEALAMFHGIQWCINAGTESIRVESDCLPLIQAVKQYAICPEWESLRLVEEIINLDKALREISFEWIPRKSNLAAD